MAKKTIEEYINEVNNLTQGEYKVIGKVYKNNKTPIKMKHLKCNHIWKPRPNDFLYGKRCPKCANNKRSEILLSYNGTRGNYLESLLEQTLDGQDYQWLQEYSNNNKDKHLMRHIKCGHKYLVRPNDFQQGYRCPNCSTSNNSKIVKWIKKYLTDNGISFEIEKKFDGLRLERSLRFDIYIPEAKLLIEYDGTQHFFRRKSSFITQDKVEENKKRDQVKNKYALNREDLNLIRISYQVKLERSIVFILDELINNNFELSEETVYEYNIYYKNKNIVRNITDYYINIRKNYFKTL